MDYISNPKRQEHLYAVYQTDGATPEFWKNLAKENQQDFKASGTSGVCIEGRELIIALPENFTEYRLDDVVQLFGEIFHARYGVECCAALHHNKAKTNYHIHLVFSEREMLEQPQIKTASRNMFYDENGKHVRTKKEILDADGNIRSGCYIVPKGEIYESHLFATKKDHFKSKAFTGEVKEMYTKLMNNYVKEESQKLSVFQPGSVYLATKKIGKNNPKEAEIKADNAVRQEWNRNVDVALVAGVPEKQIMEVKEEHIQKAISESIKVKGWVPDVLRSILEKAISALKQLIRALQLPPKPEIDIDWEQFREKQKIKNKLDDLLGEIQRAEKQELPKLVKKRDSLSKIFNRKERKETEAAIEKCEKKVSGLKAQLQPMVQAAGFKNVKEFMIIYNEENQLVHQYHREMRKWEAMTGEERKTAKEPVHPRQSILARLEEKKQKINQREQQKPRIETRKPKDRDAR